MLGTLVVVVAMLMAVMADPPGGWSLWTTWYGCTVSCGGGVSLRQRYCNNPKPTTAADLCVGDFVETRVCNDGACPAPGGWGDWGEWYGCTVTCGSGVRLRERECNNPSPGATGRDCGGKRLESSACNTQSCRSTPMVSGGWGDWGEWYGCTVTCGSGVRLRERECNNPSPGATGRDCRGKRLESSACNTQACPTCMPVDTSTQACLTRGESSWSEWTAWSKCSATCGEGRQWRQRTCGPMGLYCVGSGEETRACTSIKCELVCYRKGVADSYKGSVSTAVSGRTCWQWAYVFVFPEGRPSTYPDNNPWALGNFCRMWDSEKPYCYSYDSEAGTQREDCNVKEC